MAAASLVFRRAGDAHYAHLLLHHAQQLFEFADRYRGRYDESVEVVKSYYPSSSGYQDELLWAALWLHRATGRRDYLDYTLANADDFGGTGWAVSEFSWDIKYAGLQVLASEVHTYLHRTHTHSYFLKYTSTRLPPHLKFVNFCRITSIHIKL